MKLVPDRVTLAQLVEAHSKVRGTSSMKEKVRVMADFCRGLAADPSLQDVELGVGYLMGELRQGRVGLGPALVHEARAKVSSCAPVAELRLEMLDEAFGELATIGGKHSKRRKCETLLALLERATHAEQEFIERLLLGDLRQGALEGILMGAVAEAGEVPIEAVRRAALVGGSLREVATAALSGGEAALGEFRLEWMRPLQPMLAQTASDCAAALELLGRAAFEWKLDGARVQIHKRGNEVRVFTRARNEVGYAVPEVVERIRSLSSDRLILDGECLAMQPDRRPHPFQATMRRFGRKRPDSKLLEQLPLEPFFFDLLALDDLILLDEPASERYAALVQAVPPDWVVPRTVTGDAQTAEQFLAATLAAGHEGLMAKALDAPYQAGRRGAHWLKIKPAHTLDLVVLAAEWGSGRRKGWLSNLHLAARASDGNGFVMLGKTFKGMTDEVLVWQTEQLLKLEQRRSDHIVHVRPELVVEIALDGIQESPKYPGGLALRFARLKRYRPDKSPEEADSLEAVRALRTLR